MAAERSLSVCAFGLLVALIVTVFPIEGWRAKQALAADLAPPKLTAWQRLDAGRLMIEWPEATRVRQKKDDGQLILRFGQPLPANIEDIAQEISRFIDPADTTINDNDLALALRSGVVADVTIRQKRIIIIDFTRDPLVEPSTRIDLSTIDNGVRLTFLWPNQTDVVATSDEGKLRLHIIPDRKIEPTDLTQLQTTLRPWLDQVRLDQGLPGANLFFDLKPNVTSKVRADGPTATIIDLKRARTSPPASAPKPADHVFIPAKKPSLTTGKIKLAKETWPPVPKSRPRQEIASPKPDVSSDQAGRPNLVPIEDRPESLIFDWMKPVGAAAFVRAGYLWVVFDEPDPAMLTALPIPPLPFDDGEIVQADGGTAIRYRMKEPTTFRITQPEAGRWQIDPGANSGQTQVISVERSLDAGALRLTPIQHGQIVSLIDPAVGDRIAALPVLEVGLHQPLKQRFVDLELLPTSQGLAWRPLNDQLNMHINDQALVFSKPRGLSISHAKTKITNPPTHVVTSVAPKRPSDDADTSSKTIKPASQTTKTRSSSSSITPQRLSYLGFAGTGVDRDLAAETRRIVRQAIARAAPDQRDEARLRLARLLISERLGNEARTTLQAISDHAAPDILQQKNALLAAASYAVDRFDEAKILLNASDLDNDIEINVWRAALQSRDQDWKLAADNWRAAAKILDRYPPRLKFDLGLLAIEAAIETNDDDLIRQSFRRLTSLELSELEQAEIERMQALRSERAGDLDKARSILEGLAESPYQRIRALAEFQLADIELRENADPKDALSIVNDRLAVWRGHPNEQAILDQLAGRFGEKDEFRQALRLWRRLIERFPESGDDVDLNSARQETFTRALTNASEADFEIADPYAIYIDFVDLLPAEPEARSIHRHLSQHLTDLDLVDEAINVLKTLMVSAENDVERVELAIKIAGLMLQESRLSEALAALDGVEGLEAPLPVSLIEQSRMTKSRTLSGLNRFDDALLELQGVQSQSARALRAEIFWKARRWRRLAASIESYFADDGPATSLTPAEQKLVLWLALARSRDGTPAQLRALRNRFGDAMQESAYWGSFHVATQNLPEARDIPALLSATDQQLTELRQFRNSAPESR